MRLGLSLATLALLQVVLSLVIQLAVLRIVGVGSLTDAFVAAQAVPLVVFSIISVSLHGIWQPRMSILINEGAEWRKAQGIAQGQTLLVFGSVGIPLLLLSDLWLPLMFPGFDQVQVALCSKMTLPLIASAGLNCHSAIFITALRARDRFIRGELVALLGNALAIALIFVLVPVKGIHMAAWIIFTRALLVYILLYVLAERPLVAVRQAWSHRESWESLKPLIAGSSLYKTSPLVDRYWSSQASAGGVTLLNLAQSAMGVLATVLERAICVPAAPELARLVQRRDYMGVRRAYRRCVLLISLITALLAAGLVAIYSVWQPLFDIALNMPAPQAAEIWWICLALLGYLHVAAAGTIVVAAFYAMGDTRTPLTIGVIGFFVGVLLKSVGFLQMGLIGLASASSLYYLCNMMFMCIFLEKKIDANLS